MKVLFVEAPVTTDKNLRYQQNLAARSIAFAVLLAASWPRIHHMRHRLHVFLVSILVTACSGTSQITQQIEAQLRASSSGAVNLAKVGPASWEKVCVLTPYNDNIQAEKVLGFKWNAEANTSIAGDDGINVLVFVQAAQVVAYTEHPRNKGDFSQLQPRCLPRTSASVQRKLGPNGWVFLVRDQ